MSKNSVLFMSEEPPVTVESNVFSDLRLDKLLPGDTIAVLSRPCDIGDILSRRKIFEALADKAVADRFRAVHSALNSLAVSDRAFEFSESPLERLFLRTKQLCDCAVAAKLLGELDIPDCPLFGDFAGYWCRTIGDLPEKVERMETLTKKISEFVLSTTGVMRLKKPSGGKSLAEQIRDYASALGYTDLKVRQNTSRPDTRLSSAVTALFYEEYSELDGLVMSYESLKVSEFAEGRHGFSFYLDIIGLINRAKASGIPICYPKISTNRNYLMREAYDISIIGESIVPNDVEFDATSEFCFLTGANGGGKTTYLRAVATNLILFLSGCPVFGKSGEIYPFRRVGTHFPADERFDGDGRLLDEKKRVAKLLETADTDSFLCFNETYSGADSSIGCGLLRELTEKLTERGVFGLYVTHFHEVNELGHTVLNTVVDLDDNNRRTYRIVRSTQMRSSFAADILKKYRLDRNSLAEKL